ncbi:MAG: OmpA family protein [Prevotella sp.]|jgi:outer membrane protein OmpA-like peptidoglycan-associated protein
MKSLILATLLSCSVLSAAAQATYTDKENNEYQFKKYGFIELQGGAQYTLGEADFGDLISPNVQLTFGYHFNPWFAIRLQANAWQSKGGYNGINEEGEDAAVNTTYKYNYVAPGLDFMFNLSNAFFGWNPKRVFNLYAFVGGGANIAWNNDDAVAMADANHMRYIWDGTKVKAFGRGGLQADFRISDAVSILVEGNANILNDRYNSKKADNADWYFNGLVGLRINLGKSYTKTEPAPAPVTEPAPVKEEYVAPEPTPAPVEEKVEPIRRDIFFHINATNIEASEASKVDEIVKYMKENPNSKVTVTGYADKGTGNASINARLAAQRAETVAKALENEGISADRITSDSKGDTVQPFAENDQNRVSICIAE